jgi:hypothetical protein
LPAVLAEAHSSGFFVDHEGHDFQPYDEFLWSGETLEWWRAWTGYPTIETAPFLVFGQDGSGGLAAFWIRDPGAADDAQPVVFLGSEGEVAVIASDLGDYLWLLANGVGPLEPVDGVDREPEPIDSLVSIARRFTGVGERPVEAVFAAARAEQSPFAEFVTAATRQMTPPRPAEDADR